ncbi:hypothetical protein G9A89_018267 [Geosiphon pyriformis]|nr:hypothetical protein G9A89_018267 [Geosiphon pyriformis]
MKKFQKYVLFIVLAASHFTQSVNSYIIPSERYGHTSNLIDNRIYYFGGGYNTTNQYFYLDLSVNFTTSNPPFVNIDSLDNFPPLRYFSSVVIENSGNGSAKLLLFGGRGSTDFSLVKSINEENGPINRTHIPSIVDNKGRMYIWGGKVNQTGYLDKKMYIFDSSTNAWSQNNPIDVPETRYGYSATLLQDSKIVIIGGWDKNATYADINSVDSSPWRTITAKGLPDIQNRAAHSAILAPDEYRIIIYGGNSLVPLNPAKALIILDTRTFTWSQPTAINPPILTPGYPSATLFKNLMIVAFGEYNKDQKGSNSLWILDISKDPFTWVTSYNSSDTNHFKLNTNRHRHSPSTDTTYSTNFKALIN